MQSRIQLHVLVAAIMADIALVVPALKEHVGSVIKARYVFSVTSFFILIEILFRFYMYIK